ncbi:MAG TPA: OsmC family protein [Thermoplasmata archaeon]|nr:OsmC family protein [Thermoplasmata archaeon]
MATKTESVQVGVVNGIDVKALNGTIEAVKGNPAIAQATFAVESTLERGFQTRAKTGVVTLGGGALAGRTKTFRFEGDHPPELLGQDQGPTAVETLLAALGACVSSGFTTYGAALDIPVERVRMDLTGYIDLQGMFGLPAPGVVRPGYERIHAKIYVRSRAPRAELEKLKEMAEGLSPVKDSLRAVAYTSELIVEN